MTRPLLRLLCAAALALTARAQSVKIDQTPTALEITIDGQPFTTYRYAKTPDDPEWRRPYFFPVRAADGVELTDDQWRLQQKAATDAERKKIDHPHHRSVWVSHGDVNGLDHWSHLQKVHQQHVKFTKVDGDTFVEELAWEGKEPGKPVLTETRTVRVLAYPDGARGLDVTSTITAASGDAVFKVKPLNVSGVEAGWLACRVPASFVAAQKAGKATILSSAGAKGEPECRAKPAAWCDYSGPAGPDAKPYGVTLFDHPKNDGSPTPFHVRAWGLLAHIGPHDWTLENGKSRTIRHRLIFHPGDAAAAKIEERYKEFAADAK